MINLGVDVTGGDILPDGSGLVITANREGGYGVDLYSLTTGRIVRRIVNHGGDYPTDLSVSANGKFLCFTGAPATGKPRDLWIIDLAEGAKPRPLLQTPFTDMHGAVSPNGKWVACTSEMSGRREVHVVGVPDGQPNRQITYHGGSEPAWSPDGKWLYYIGQEKLMRVAMSEDARVTSPPEVIYDKPFGQSDSIARNMTVAPDGRPVIVEPSERRPKVSNLQVIINWWTLLPK
jgi:Tol biopolymer transport system component